MPSTVLSKFLLSSFVLSKNIKIQVFRTVMLSFVLCGFETWSVTLREEHWLRLNHIHQHMHITELKVILKLFLPICSAINRHLQGFECKGMYTANTLISYVWY